MTHAASAEWRAAVHAALLAGAMTLTPPASASPAETPVFAPPTESSMLLSRRVVRELSGGATIVATRRYRVMFRRLADGWEIDGALIASEIDVPPALAALAAIERDRPDDGLFPMRLDRAGHIVASQAAPRMGREAVASAVAATRRQSGASSTAASPGFLDQVGAAAASPGGGLTRWPEALFVPDGLHGTVEQSFELPDGSAGSVRVTLESDPAFGPSTTMSRASRKVVTEAAGTRRVAWEEWTLVPAPGQ